MSAHWESRLEEWINAEVVDAATAQRIRAWERQNARTRGLQWPTIMALALGALLLGAGVLLFVSAHWDYLSPLERMSYVLLLVSVFHVGGAITSSRFEGLSVALHAVGTVALGAGISLTGQIFHLSRHWPAAVLLWAVGAALAWVLLRHWTQALFAAILFPAWLASEWFLWSQQHQVYYGVPVTAGLCAVSFVYLSARRSDDDSTLRKGLALLGCIALLPSALSIFLDWPMHLPNAAVLISVACIIAVPLGVLAAVLRGSDALLTAVALGWTFVSACLTSARADLLVIYAWCALGAIGLAVWGVRDARPERINLGMAGFALTVLMFYFSTVMDKLGRSASLASLGFLFLGGGWMLERMRRQLISQITPENV